VPAIYEHDSHFAARDPHAVPLRRAARPPILHRMPPSPRSRPPAPKLVHRPVQRRSRDTHAAIVRTFRDALAVTPYEDIGIAALAKAARISVGGFYARFASKDALLLPLVESMIEEFTQSLDRALDPLEGGAGDLARLATAYVGAMIPAFRRNRRVLMEAVRHARGDTSVAIAERMHAFNEHAHGRFRALAWARRAEIAHRSPRMAIEVALFMASATGREVVIDSNWRSYTVHPDDDTLVRELVAAMVAYLASGAPRRGTRVRGRQPR
jgi:AcrR family transcriptional regulator